MSTAYTDSGASATRAPAPRSAAISNRHPALFALLIAVALIAASVFLAFLLTAAAFGYPGGGIA